MLDCRRVLLSLRSECKAETFQCTNLLNYVKTVLSYKSRLLYRSLPIAENLIFTYLWRENVEDCNLELCTLKSTYFYNYISCATAEELCCVIFRLR
jgi:hypothetical protein